MTHKRIGLAISIMLLTFLFVTSCTRSDKSATYESSEPVDFALSDLSGKTVTLSEYRGKVVVLDFWATWCKPCLTEIPTFNRIHRNYSGNGDFALITIANESGDTDDLIEFTKNNSIGYPVLMGNRITLQNFRIPGFPTTLIINKEGKIAARIIGSRPNLYKLLSREVERLLTI
jgi:thiol-disulfide isomerase/thioredoxin